MRPPVGCDPAVLDGPRVDPYDPYSGTIVPHRGASFQCQMPPARSRSTGPPSFWWRSSTARSRSSVGELAEATDLPKSTVSRLVAALERHGLVQRDGVRAAAAARAGADAPRPPRRRRPRPGRPRAPTRSGALGRGERRDDQPGRADAARRRAPRARSTAATSSARRTGSAAGSPHSTHGGRQGLPGVRRRPPDARARPRCEPRARGRARARLRRRRSTSSSRASRRWPRPCATASGDVLAALSISGPERPPDDSAHRRARTRAGARGGRRLSARLGYRTTTQGAA